MYCDVVVVVVVVQVSIVEEISHTSALTIYYTALSSRCRPDRRCERVRWTQRRGEQRHVHEEHHGECILSFLLLS